MKLYKKSDFVQLPGGTIYSRWSETELCSGLYCKGDTVYQNDFIEQDLLSEAGFPLSNDSIPLHERNMDGMDNFEYQMDLRDEFKEFETDLHCAGRDGMFDNDDKFIVWNKNDVRKLIDYLTKAIS